MGLDSETKEFIAGMVNSGSKPMSDMTMAEIRSMPSLPAEMFGVMPKIEERKKLVLPVKDGNINLYVFKPSTETDAVILYYHGGGWVTGDAGDTAYQKIGILLANHTNSTVVLVNYRKAPEYPFPNAIEDSYKSLIWAEQNIIGLAGKNVPIIVAGDSAGGNLCAVLTHRARNENGPKISMQVLIYPVTSDNFNTNSYNNPENQLLLDKTLMEWFWNHYISNSADRKNESASPLYSSNFNDLPPAVVITAGYDPLMDEGKAYADKLNDAGALIEYRNFQDQMHGFFSFPDFLPRSNEALNFIAEKINDHLINKSPK